MKHSERVPEIKRSIVEGELTGRCLDERGIDRVSQVPLRDHKGIGTRINAHKRSDAWRDISSPSPTATAEIEASGVRRQSVPRETCEVLIEDLAEFFLGQSTLVESGPLVTESVDDVGTHVAIWLMRVVGSPHRGRVYCATSAHLPRR